MGFTKGICFLIPKKSPPNNNSFNEIWESVYPEHGTVRKVLAGSSGVVNLTEAKQDEAEPLLMPHFLCSIRLCGLSSVHFLPLVRGS